MSTGNQHDWIDLLGALGPTLATVFAGIATIHVYLRGEKLQRQLVRPLIAVRQQIKPVGQFWRWRVKIRNEGQGAANIESLTVVAKEEIIFHELMEPPTEYWGGVLAAAGALRIQQIVGNVLSPPVSIGGGSALLLFDATIAGQRADIDAIVRNVEIRGKCTSAFGERSSFRSRFGRDDR